MNNDNEPNLPTPKSTLDQLKEWKELAAFIAVEAASVLGIFLSTGAAQIASSVLAAAVVFGGSWQFRRSHQRKKQREEQERLWEERRKQPRAAFRSLSPFEEQDELPGQDRKQQARSIAVRIVNDDFRFGIVCGDSGAGKTSLLRSEVMRQIQANGLEPVYLRSPRRLAGTTSANATGCERLAAELDAFEQESIPAAACVLILDQFEEWFVEYREPETRALLGRFIARLISRVPPVRVVCAVRREFLMDFHDLSAELPNPTNPTNTFRVRNFTVAQAVDAVQQCALADGIAAEESFAAALAADLEENGEVRPPELQIVCTHLAESGSLSSSRYQAEGGTAGILAHYIKNALESCREPDLGAKLLRSLCDFPTRTKRPPKTLAELAADIGRTAGSQTVAALVRTFVLTRLLAEEKRKSGPDAYALLHDYLVGAVELATGDVSTQTEEANQLLRYHLAQQRGVIPLRRLCFIRAHADKPLLAQPNARRLVRKSLIVPAVFSGAVALVAVLMAGGLYLMKTAQVQWQAKVIGRHWGDKETGNVDYEIFPAKGLIVGTDSFQEKGVLFWSVTNGNITNKIEDEKWAAVDITSNGDFLLLKKESPLVSKDHYRYKLIDVYNGIETELPNSSECKFYNSEQYVICQSVSDDTTSLLIWSILDKKTVYTLSDIKIFYSSLNFKFNFNNRRLVVFESDKKEREVISLYDTLTNKKIKEITSEKNTGTRYFDINQITRSICTISKAEKTNSVLQVWDIDDGVLKKETDIGDFEELDYNFLFDSQLSYRGQDVLFSPDGLYVFVRKLRALIKKDKISKREDIVKLIPTSNIIPAHWTNSDNIRICRDSKRYLMYPIVYWRDRNDAVIWEFSDSRPSILKNTKLSDSDRVSSSDNLQRAVIWGPQRPAELWDLKEKKLLRQLTSSKDKHIQSVAFSMNDTAVVITEEGGLASLFDAKDGSPLAQHISAAEVYYYDPDLRRIHVWNSSGQVLRYVEGRSYFGCFVPTKKGAQD